jgi:nucleotide-binding universal stress UspA family protein
MAMSPFASILCAVDFSNLAPRVLRHAVGLAGACGARLAVITVTHADRRAAEARVLAMLSDVVPAGASYLATPDIQVVYVAVGGPADAILGRAREGVDLIVAGTHSRSGLSRWLLGSTSAAIMEEAMCPTLLVPPGDLEIVTLTASTAALHPGTVLAAVDPTEHNDRQLALASQLASIARQPLALMTVVDAAIVAQQPLALPTTVDAAATEQAAEEALRARAKALGLTGVDRFIVRRGQVADQIDQTAMAVHAGLVVMGLRGRGHGRPGEIASSVLKTKDAVVLAVPAS